MDWIYQDTTITEIPKDYIAMVYEITNLTSGRRYIGKKGFFFTKVKQVKGKKKKIKVDSDWSVYYGSNKELLADIEKLGKEQFRREILYLCKSKGEASYLEAKEQFLRNAILSEEYYNEYIMVRVRNTHLKGLAIP